MPILGLLFLRAFYLKPQKATKNILVHTLYKNLFKELAYFFILKAQNLLKRE